MECKNCGAVTRGNRCEYCGAEERDPVMHVVHHYDVPSPQVMRPAPIWGPVKTDDRNRVVAIILAFFLGALGIHKFYLGKKDVGVVYFLFCWTGVPTILGVIDAIILASMSDRKFDEKHNCTMGWR